MPKLSQMQTLRTSFCIYGPPKSGKTLLAGHLAVQGYNLYYIDLENSAETLLQLPMEAQERIELISVLDTKDNPNGIDTVLRLITGAKTKICHKHGKHMCVECLSKAKTDPSVGFSEYEFASLGPNDIVVIDGMTQLTSSANAHATRKLDRDKGENEEFSHWRYQGTMLEKVLDLCQNNSFTIGMICHEMGIEQEDGVEKIMPAGGTKNFARNVAKYFGHIIYCSVVNGKHKAISLSTSANKILTGSRTGVDISSNPQERIADIMKNLRAETRVVPTANVAAGIATSVTANKPATSNASALASKFIKASS